MLNLKKLMIRLVKQFRHSVYESRLKQKEDNLERYASYLRGKKYFIGSDGKQNYLVFQLMYEYLKRVIATANNISTIYVHSWTLKGVSNEQIKAPNTSTNNDHAPILEYDRIEISLKFTGDLLKQSRVTYNHGSKRSIFVVYKLNTHTINTDFALKDCLFGSVKIAKDKDPDNYAYSGFVIGFDSKSPFNHSDGTDAHNVIIFCADSCQSVHYGNKLAKDVLILGKDFIQKIDKETVYADDTFPTNFTVTKFCLSLHFDGLISRLFVNVKQQVLFKGKDSEITPYKLCLGKIFTDFSATNAQKTSLHGNIHDFSVEHGVFSDFEIHDIHAYLMKKTILYKMFKVIKEILAIIFLASNANSLKCISIENQECKVREVIINNEYMIYPFSIKVNKCNGNCNNIRNPYSRVCLSNIIKNITLKIFDLISWKNKTKQIKWHKNC